MSFEDGWVYGDNWHFKHVVPFFLHCSIYSQHCAFCDLPLPSLLPRSWASVFPPLQMSPILQGSLHEVTPEVPSSLRLPSLALPIPWPLSIPGGWGAGIHSSRMASCSVHHSFLHSTSGLEIDCQKTFLRHLNKRVAPRISFGWFFQSSELRWVLCWGTSGLLYISCLVARVPCVAAYTPSLSLCASHMHLKGWRLSWVYVGGV